MWGAPTLYQFQRSRPGRAAFFFQSLRQETTVTLLFHTFSTLTIVKLPLWCRMKTNVWKVRTETLKVLKLHLKNLKFEQCPCFPHMWNSIPHWPSCLLVHTNAHFVKQVCFCLCSWTGTNGWIIYFYWGKSLLLDTSWDPSTSAHTSL